ncbi:hypothetical protein V6U89_19385 [Micromonospora sp. CPCC 206171]|uniref:hypothetical protein n=1 Tax=Micromonospora sp. CPCC 206171 TaxID=3122405 RepID=UPI002FF38457
MRILDEHMYRLENHDGTAQGACRLQLFTADGRRPVAVATQTIDEFPSLTNSAEEYATQVWQQFLPDYPTQPIWIQRSLSDSFPPHVAYVTFIPDPERRQLVSPEWHIIEDDDIDILVAQPVDRSRGTGYLPPEPEPEAQPRYARYWVALLPRPRPFREPGCMPTGVRWWRRIARQLVPRRGGSTCCWYHGGDWHTVSDAAIQLVQQARTAGVPARDIAAYVGEQAAEDATLSAWEREALATLVSPAWAIQPFESARGFVNGQHRAQALLDAGVRRTIVMYWEDAAAS